MNECTREVFNYYDFSPGYIGRPGELRTHFSKDHILTEYTYDDHEFMSLVESVTQAPENANPVVTNQYNYTSSGQLRRSLDADGRRTNYEYYGETDLPHLRGCARSSGCQKAIIFRRYNHGKAERLLVGGRLLKMFI